MKKVLKHTIGGEHILNAVAAYSADMPTAFPVPMLRCLRHDFRGEKDFDSIPTRMRQGEILNLRWDDVDCTRGIFAMKVYELLASKGGSYRRV